MVTSNAEAPRFSLRADLGNMLFKGQIVTSEKIFQKIFHEKDFQHQMSGSKGMAGS